MKKKTALFYASLEIMRELINAGANINIKDNEGKTVLICSATKPESILAELINGGADINMQDNEGKTVLMYASPNGNAINVLRFLIREGADLNAEDNEGKTALFYTMNYSYSNFQELVDGGVDVNAKDNNGETVLFYAFNKKSMISKSWIKTVLDNGADIELKDNSNKDAYYYARHGKKAHRVMAKLLRESGAKENPFWSSIKIDTKCKECAQEVVVNGPFKKVKCGFCLSEVYPSDNFWNTAISKSKEDIPICDYCEKLTGIYKLDLKNDSSLKCSHCGKISYSYTAPEWFRKLEKNGLHPQFIISAQRNGNTETGPKSMEPIAIRCISCSAVLTVSVDTPRNTKCDHCGTVQYLPDPLWLSLHPFKKMIRWFVRFA